MNIFVSYTTRNNEVTISSLINLSNKLKSIGNTFIDLIDNKSFDKQARIVKELKESDLLILIKSQSSYNSKWVQFELESAKNKNIPIIEFNIDEIMEMTEKEIELRIKSITA